MGVTDVSVPHSKIHVQLQVWTIYLHCPLTYDTTTKPNIYLQFYYEAYKKLARNTTNSLWTCIITKFLHNNTFFTDFLKLLGIFKFRAYDTLDLDFRRN